MNEDFIACQWSSFQRQLEIGHAYFGAVVDLVPFGMFVDIGSTLFLGLVERWNIADPPMSMQAGMPEIGVLVPCVLVAFHGRQPRLSMRPSLVSKAIPSLTGYATDRIQDVWRIEHLPSSLRLAAVWKALLDDDVQTSSAALWQTRVLDVHERAEVVHWGLGQQNVELAVRAAWQIQFLAEDVRVEAVSKALAHSAEFVAYAGGQQVRYLPIGQRSAALTRLLQRQSAILGKVAVERVELLPEAERLSLLTLALRDRGALVSRREMWRSADEPWPQPNLPLGSEVAATAVGYVRKLPAETREHFLHLALQQEGVEVASRAVGMAQYLDEAQRIALLQMAAEDSRSEVAARAKYELRANDS